MLWAEHDFQLDKVSKTLDTVEVNASLAGEVDRALLPDFAANAQRGNQDPRNAAGSVVSTREKWLDLGPAMSSRS